MGSFPAVVSTCGTPGSTLHFKGEGDFADCSSSCDGVPWPALDALHCERLPSPLPMLTPSPMHNCLLPQALGQSYRTMTVQTIEIRTALRRVPEHCIQHRRREIGALHAG